MTKAKLKWDKLPKWDYTPKWDKLPEWKEPIMTLQDWDDYLSGGLETNDEKQSDDDRKRNI